MKIFFTKRNKGFTLVETLVAISIFSMSILVMMVALGQSISNTHYVKQKVLATYLAQEGIEYMRNLRDTYMLYSNTPQEGWDAFNQQLLDASCDYADSRGCYFDDQNVNFADPDMPMTELDFSPCSTGTCSDAPLLYDSATGKYGYASGTNSGFSRYIVIGNAGTDYTIVYSAVYWAQGSGVYYIAFSESLFNWVE